MLQKMVFILAINITSAVSAGVSTELDPFRVKQETSIEFALGGPHWPKPPKEDNATRYGSIAFAVKDGPSCPRPPKGSHKILNIF
ncbi:hypothetical protein H0A36_25240 [Endozoicomonas sp. SM1973]|uniref:Uncharacterized protein n=1 Tax=Spartinivicinus marinus TaxID=2994442 RepID=A0A853I8Z3_9GAMM|nr:hypothetical protein [Spartinivicinus marinus]MCX4027576.1 hypothetical protein [Spartinivicinus marinus]NYZ69329.1 hypothetical protein [Spartinivicinus marinus]